MADDKPKRGRPPKAKQGHLEGMEPPVIKEIERAADRYVEARDERMRLSETEAEAKELLTAVMKKHELTVYNYDGKDVFVENAETVKVRKHKEPGDGD